MITTIWIFIALCTGVALKAYFGSKYAAAKKDDDLFHRETRSCGIFTFLAGLGFLFLNATTTYSEIQVGILGVGAVLMFVGMGLLYSTKTDEDDVE